jgi:DNA-binding MarR family transcriptional regulator
MRGAAAVLTVPRPLGASMGAEVRMLEDSRLAGVPEAGDELDSAPVFPQDPLDLRLSVATLIHWADSREVREQVMRTIGFPVDDIGMFLVVNQLSYRGALRPSALASALGTGAANVSKIVARLEAIGLVRRARSTSDERSVLVVLTPEGRVYGERIAAETEQTMRRATDGWSAAEVDMLRRLMSRFAAHATQEIASRSPSLRP